MRSLRINSFSNFAVYHAAVLAVVIVLWIISLVLICLRS